MTRSMLAAGCAVSALSFAFSTSVFAQVAPGSTQGRDASVAAPQQAGSPPAKSVDTSGPGTTLNEIVVTGVATAGGLKKLDAAYSVTSLSQEQIKQANAPTFADILKTSPGVYVESSSGPAGANVEVAGFPGSAGAPYVTVELNGASLFPISGTAYLEPTTLFRLDDSIQRIELIQGGPGVLYGNGQPGLTANYILKQGTDTLSGDLGFTYGSEGSERVDGFVGGPLSEKNGLYASLGGFWIHSDGVRDPQFAADSGGQVTATLTKRWSDGSLMVYGRYLKYDAEFVTDTPLLNPQPGQFSAYPGFSPLTGTMESKADQYEQLQVAPCAGAGCVPGSVPVNIANGRGPNMYTVGEEFKKDFGNGLQILDDASYSNGATHMVAFYSTGLNPEPLSTYIANAEAADKLPGGLVASAYYTNNGASAPLSQNVLTQTLRYVTQKFNSASNELHLSYEVVPGNTLTVGNYTTIYHANEVVYTGAQMLLQAISNPTPIGVDLMNGANTYQLSSSQGFVNATTSATHNYGSGVNTAFFLTDRWKVQNFLFDAGVRTEHESFNDYYQNTASGSLNGGNIYSLYNNSAQYLVPGAQRVGYSRTGISWTVGLNYEFDPHMSAYARINEGVHFAGFGDITLTNESHFPLQTAHNYQVGYKYQNDFIYADLSGFYRTFSNVSTSGLFNINNVEETVFFAYGSTTAGLEYQIDLKPFQWLGGPFQRFTISTTGDYAHGTYNNSSGCVSVTNISNSTSQLCNSSLDYDGYLLARQPVFQTRITPAYTLPTSWGGVKAWATIEYVGDHYGDQRETQYLGTYYDLSFGITGDVGQHLEWTVRGTNVTNQIGLTEGNGRVLTGSATTNGVILARSIEGSEVNAQIKYKF